MNKISPSHQLAITQTSFALIIFASAFQSVPAIRYGAYSTIKLVDLSLLFFFVIASTQSMSTRAWISAFIAMGSILAHELIFYTLGKGGSWMPALIFMGRITLITLAVVEYISIPDKGKLNKHIFEIYLRLVYISIIYSCYESYLLLNGLAPALVPESLNGAGEPISRLRGMFSEPSLYVLFLTPAFLAQIYRNKYWSATLIGGALVLTVSTFVVVVLGIAIILFSTPRNTILIAMAAFAAIGIAIYSFGSDFVVYSFVDKFWAYLSFSATTDVISDSAGIRKTTADFGSKIAMEHFPYGVGYGKSVAALRAEFPAAVIDAGIVSPDIPIQSAFPQLLAESGMFGFLAVLPLLLTFFHLIENLTSRQALAFLLYTSYILIIIYPIENPIIWIFSILFSIAMSYSPNRPIASNT